jgi:hypothetical protein
MKKSTKSDSFKGMHCVSSFVGNFRWFFFGGVGRGGKFMSFLLPFILVCIFCMFIQPSQGVMCILYGFGCTFFAGVNVPSIHNQREWQALNPYPLSKKERTSVSETHENTHHHHHQEDTEEALSFAGSSKQKLLHGGMILPFQKLSITFDDITYSVDVPQVYSKHFNLSLCLSLSLSLHSSPHNPSYLHNFFSFSCPSKSQHQSTEYIIKLLVKYNSVGHDFGCQFRPPLVIFMPSQKLSM